MYKYNQENEHQQIEQIVELKRQNVTLTIQTNYGICMYCITAQGKTSFP